MPRPVLLVAITALGFVLLAALRRLRDPPRRACTTVTDTSRRSAVLTTSAQPESAWAARTTAARRYATSLSAPVLLGAGCALLLFAVFLFGALNSWTPLAATYARDYITLPRCGLAARFGTDLFTSSEDYPWYGPVGNGWLSHPALCLTLGVPTSYLPPLFGFKLLNVAYLAMHVGIIAAFGRRLSSPYRPRDFVTFAALGLFFPWYVMYVTGNYHALSVLALALVLAGPKRRVHGFILSAMGKPLLAPAGLVLLLRGHIRESATIVALAAVVSVPFVLFGYTPQGGLNLGGSALAKFVETGSGGMRFVIPHWDQQTSVGAAIDELFPGLPNLQIRLLLAALLLAVATVGLRRKPIEVAVALATMWFFILYARGHEYHATLLVPILAYLWTEPRGLYRTRWMAALGVAVALPTAWPIFTHVLGLPGASQDSFAFMRDASTPLFVVFIAHKPAVAISLVATIVWTELRPARRGDDGRA